MTDRSPLEIFTILGYCINCQLYYDTPSCLNSEVNFAMNWSLLLNQVSGFTLGKATKAQRGLEVQLYSFFNLGARWRWVITRRPGLFTPLEWPSTHCTHENGRKFWLEPHMNTSAQCILSDNYRLSLLTARVGRRLSEQRYYDKPADKK
jgi:hypothetical protein